ncbi:MAG TPA: intradiol ring-cleavage dioxygenase [Candidatus Limnocylindrales bacterium]
MTSPRQVLPEASTNRPEYPSSSQSGPLVPVATFEGRRLPYPDEPAFDQGLAFDVETLMDRRRVLKILGFGAVAAGLAACGVSSSPLASLTGGSPQASGTSSSAAGTAAADCAVIPEETAGPFPGDGSNGPDILTQSGVVRADVRSSFGASSTVATGVPLTIKLAIQDLAKSCAPLANAAVYLWHCDQQGRYSMYSQGVTNENYLRGVQAAGADGVVTFQSIFPACYSGRWPHIHFEVYPSIAKATDPANKIATSQIALPEATCKIVYATSGYEQSVTNLSQVSLKSDNVFGDDGGVHELGTIRGDVSSGMTVTLAVPVRAA